MDETTAVPASGPAPVAAPPASGGTGAPSPAPTTTDRGGVTEATGAPAAEASNLTAEGAQNVAPETSGSDAAANLFPSEEELRRMPRQWADRFGNLKKGYDTLESDHRELKTRAENWKGLETFGDPAAIQRELEVLRAFRTVQRDEQGNIQYDQATGLPVFDVRPGLEKLAEQSPAMPRRMFKSLLGWKGDSGESLAREWFHDLGIDPDRLPEIRSFLSGELNVASNNSGVISPEILDRFSAEDQEAIKSMDAELLQDFDLLTEGAQKALIAQAKRDLETKKFQNDVREWQEAQAKASEDLFQNDLRQAQATYITGIRENTINSIVEGLAGQVTWSTDPNVQAVQQGVIRATLVSLLDPDFRFASRPMLEALGLQIDSLDQAIGEITQNAQLQTRYETYGKHPAYAKHRDDFAMGQARQAVDAGVLSAKAVLNNVALAIAQAFGGQVRARAEQIDQRLAQAKARPVLNGTATTTETTASPERPGKPFSKERWESRGIG